MIKGSNNYYLFTLVNVSENGALNGEHENMLFCRYDQAHDYMMKNIEMEINEYSETHRDTNELKIDSICNDIVNLWFDKNCKEGVLYRITNVCPQI